MHLTKIAKSLAIKGATASVTRTFTNKDIAQFALLSGDNNPIHIDNKHKNIVHGTLLIGMFSQIGGTQLPGNGSLLSKITDMRFHQPVHAGRPVIANLEIVDILRNQFAVAKATVVCPEKDTVFVSGKIILTLPKK